MKIFSLEQIQESINITKDLEELISPQKAAFIDYSSGLYDVPAPVQFVFPGPRSDCHIKVGYRQVVFLAISAMLFPKSLCLKVEDE